MTRLVRAWCIGSALLLFISSVSHAFAAEHLSGSGGVDPAILSDGSAAYTPGISERRSSVSRFYHFGAQGENGRETASNESTASSRTWDAWGNPLSATGSTNSPFGFLGGLGGEFGFDSSLIFIGRATYDASTGRTLTPPERGGRNGGGNNWGGPGGHAPGSVSHGPLFAFLEIPYLDGKPDIAYDATPWWQKALDGLYDTAVGWGDGVSGGGSILVRELLGANDAVDFDSPWYQGGLAAGVAHGAVISRGLKAPAACFVAGTMILMADGSKKPIEEIQPGDLLMSRDEATGKTEAKEVVRVFERGSSELVVIRLANGEEIKTTPEHPFWVKGKGWTIAGDLTPVDRLTTTSSTSSISTIQWKRTPSKVYNFEVRDFHTYFVGAGVQAVWVHNACTNIPRGGVYIGRTRADTAKPNLPYVGQSKDVATRIGPGHHKLDPNYPVDFIPVQGGKNARRRVEQLLIDEIGLPKLGNERTAIAPQKPTLRKPR